MGKCRDRVVKQPGGELLPAVTSGELHAPSCIRALCRLTLRGEHQDELLPHHHEHDAGAAKQLHQGKQQHQPVASLASSMSTYTRFTSDPVRLKQSRYVNY